MKIAVIGNGAWGTALSLHFTKFYPTCLITKSAQSAGELTRTRENRRYLPDFALPETLHIGNRLPDLSHSDLIIIAVPVAAVRQVLTAIPLKVTVPLLIAAKGFERQTALLPHQIAAEIFPQHSQIGLFSGPTFAQELAAGLPCAICLSTLDRNWGEQTARLLNNNIMRVYVNDDPVGVGVGGAVKNIIAVAAGFADGRHCGQNARAAVITRGLAEMTRLALALGAKEDTMRGLGTLGDLILTCTGELSRNRQVGLQLARGRSLQEILPDLGHVAEGINTLTEVLRLAREKGVDMPIAVMLEAVLDGSITADAVLDLIMARTPRAESR